MSKAIDCIKEATEVNSAGIMDKIAYVTCKK